MRRFVLKCIYRFKKDKGGRHMVYIAIMQHRQSATAGTVREKARAERLAAYALLSALYEKIYGASLPAISRAEGGKPYFKGDNMPGFNISHTDGACLAAIDTEGIGIGADIQIKIADAVAERVGKRFPFVECTECGRPIAELLIFEGREDRGEITVTPLSLGECGLQASTVSGFSAKWALTEAVLKADGGGFGNACKLGELKNYESVSFVWKEKYFISAVRLADEK